WPRRGGSCNARPGPCGLALDGLLRSGLLLLAVRIAAAAQRPPRLGLRLERLPDHFGLWILGRREDAIDALAARPVDPHPADPRRSNERNLGLVLECGLRPFFPHRRGNAAALGISAQRLGIVVSQ